MSRQEAGVASIHRPTSPEVMACLAFAAAFQDRTRAGEQIRRAQDMLAGTTRRSLIASRPWSPRRRRPGSVRRWLFAYGIPTTGGFDFERALNRSVAVIRASQRLERLAALVTPRLPRALRHRDYGLLWGGQTVSVVGDGIYTIAIALEALHVSDRASTLAYVEAARIVPSALLLLVAAAVGPIGRQLFFSFSANITMMPLGPRTYVSL
jgi:hypothetical protein